ncbi:hypothetical protein Tcan_11505 [Toxocara canis]|uniref:Uncharacterized protein n=1 Tax=Toxocara canis TaxID=6265 RepID=A0A0B2V8U6_TOXCA|nr:hypothetical protein Tcan_11505 [Toxocara canis]
MSSTLKQCWQLKKRNQRTRSLWTQMEFIDQARHPPELRQYEEALANGAVTLDHLRNLKLAWKWQQLRASLLLPPCEPDAYNLEEIFKNFFVNVWGGWESGQHLRPFDPDGAFESEFLMNCVMLQWKLQDEKLNFDKAPIIIHAKSPGNNFQRTYGPSMQVCILGLDPSLLHRIRFEAEIKLEGSNINQHTLELMEKQNTVSRYTRLPFVVDGTLNSASTTFALNPLSKPTTEQGDELSSNLPRRRKTRKKTPEDSKSIEEMVRSKVKRLVIDCDWVGKTALNPWMNPLYRKELRGCKDEHNDECRMDYEEDVCMRHCIKANFFQLGVSRINEKNKQQYQDLFSYIQVNVELHFRNGVIKTLQERTHPFIVSPGKDQPKDSDLFLEFAWRTLTGQLMSSNFADQSKPKRKSEDEILKRTSVKWKELREFIKVSFRARNPYIRELDKTVKTKLLFSQRFHVYMHNTVFSRKSSRVPVPHFALNSFYRRTR